MKGDIFLTRVLMVVGLSGASHPAAEDVPRSRKRVFNNRRVFGQVRVGDAAQVHAMQDKYLPKRAGAILSEILLLKLHVRDAPG